MFFWDLASKFFNYTKINNHSIQLVDSKQSPYRLIYSLKPMKLETLKAYIEINLINRFIKLSKSPISATIFFNQKSDRSL